MHLGCQQCLDTVGRLHVQDVGLAKILTRDNTHVSMEGTFDWAAPEVLAGQECSEKADIWSLGVVLWEIVTGERPHLRQLRPLRCVYDVRRELVLCTPENGSCKKPGRPTHTICTGHLSFCLADVAL